MRPKYYDENNIVRIQKRISYYEIYIKGLNKPFYIDHDDKWLLKKYKLTYNGNYILAGSISLHRLIKIGPIVHHINHNKLDNRKCNLEILKTNSEHMTRHFKKTGEMSRSRFTLDQDMIDIMAELSEDDNYSIEDLCNIKHLL